MRILLLTSVEHQSGSALRFRGMAGALARAGWETHLWEPAPPGSDVETPPNVQRHPCPRLPGAPELQAPLWMAHAMAAVRRVRPDVVWVLKGLPHVWIPARAAARRGARVVVDLDDLDYAYYPPGPKRRLVERFFRRAARDAEIVTVHNETMRALAEELRGTERPCLFVEQGIDVARFADARPSAQWRERLGPGPVLLYAGHLGPASDLAPLLPALAPLAAANPSARLLVVGGGREQAALESLAQRSLPPGFATFAGMVEHREIPQLFALADVALNFLEDVEANRYRASIKVREALAAGIPVVTSATVDTRRFDAWVRFPKGEGAAAFVEAVGHELESGDRAQLEGARAWLQQHGTFDAAIRPLLDHWGSA